jgi:hypothetical protein
VLFLGVFQKFGQFIDLEFIYFFNCRGVIRLLTLNNP